MHCGINHNGSIAVFAGKINCGWLSSADHLTEHINTRDLHDHWRSKHRNEDNNKLERADSLGTVIRTFRRQASEDSRQYDEETRWIFAWSYWRFHAIPEKTSFLLSMAPVFFFSVKLTQYMVVFFLQYQVVSSNYRSTNRAGEVCGQESCLDSLNFSLDPRILIGWLPPGTDNRVFRWDHIVNEFKKWAKTVKYSRKCAGWWITRDNLL